ncbi:MAG: wax ester/triacylglycerol synthase family O-acyltransferase [Halioglobus sp.]
MKPLSSDDAFFLYAETEEQHQHTLGVLILDPATARNPAKVTVKRLSDKLKSDIHVLPEFRQKLAKLPMALAPPVLIDDPDFNADDHIEIRSLKSPGSLRQLSKIVSQFASKPLNKNRPLWETLFIEGLEGGKLAVCSKSHHLIADGVQGAEFMSEQFDFEPHPPKKKGKSPGKWSPRQQSALDILGASWSKHRKDQPGFRTMVDKTLKSFRSRKKLFQKKKQYEDLVTPMIPKAPTLKFNGAITPNRTIALGSVPMATLKAIKNHYDVTLNDVILAACTLSLRDYLIDTEDLPSEPLVCAVPVSLKLKGQDASGGNAVGNMIVKLPVQIEDPLACLAQVHDYTLAAKDVFDESFENLMMGYLGMMPPGVANAAMKTMFNRRVMDVIPTQMNLCVSNFPGPPIPLFMEGAELLGTYPIGPVMSGSGLNITFMSQLDDMNFSVQTCKEKLPEAWELADGVSEWVDRMAASINPGTGKKPATRKVTPKTKTAGKPKGTRKKNPKPTPPLKKKVAVKKKAAVKKKVAAR